MADLQHDCVLLATDQLLNTVVEAIYKPPYNFINRTLVSGTWVSFTSGDTVIILVVHQKN
jgi:hypothetical protein